MKSKFGLGIAFMFIVLGLVGYTNSPLIGLDGLFYSDNIHNTAHVVVGLMILYFTLKTSVVSFVLKLVGVFYLSIAVLGLLSISEDGIGIVFGFISVNQADNWLHVILGIILLLGGVAEEEEEIIKV